MNQTNKGSMTYVAAAAIAKGKAVKFSSGKVTPVTAKTDIAIGIALDGAAAGELCPVAIAGVYPETVSILSGGSITAGQQVNVLGNAETSSDTSEILIGTALTTATASGQLVEIAHCVAARK